MRAQLLTELHTQRDQALAEITNALRIATLTAAGHKLPDVQRQLKLTDPQMRSARARLRAAIEQRD